MKNGIIAPLINAPVYLESAYHSISELWVNLGEEKTRIIVETYSSKEAKKKGESYIHRRAYHAPVSIDSLSEAYGFIAQQEEFKNNSLPEKSGTTKESVGSNDPA